MIVEKVMTVFKLQFAVTGIALMCSCALPEPIVQDAVLKENVNQEENVKPEINVKPEMEVLKNGLIARDLLVAASQIFNPIETTVQLNTPTTAFGEELEVGLREVGFGVQRVASDQGDNFFSYNKTTSENSGEIPTTSYQLFIGDIGFERTYVAMSDGVIAPVGPMTVYGTEEPIQLSPELFPGQSVEVSYAKNDDFAIEPNAITIIDTSVMSAIAELGTGELPSYKSLNSQNQAVENLFERESSNFESIDTLYRTVRRENIVFSDDSLVLERRGRDQISKLMKFFEPDSDVFRLIGCSIGSTNVEGGNVELALGRSERVAKELVARSVGLEAIFDEGCWSPEEAQEGDFWHEGPARAVIVELQRKG